MIFVLVFAVINGLQFSESTEVWQSEFGCRLALAEAKAIARPTYAYCIRVEFDPKPEARKRPAKWNTT